MKELESQKETLAALPRAERVAAYSWQLSNVRSALEWTFGPHGNDEIATKLAAASTRLFMELALLIEWRTWAERALDRLGSQLKNARHGMVVTAGSQPHLRSASSSGLDVALVQPDLVPQLSPVTGLFMHA